MGSVNLVVASQPLSGQPIYLYPLLLSWHWDDVDDANTIMALVFDIDDMLAW